MKIENENNKPVAEHVIEQQATESLRDSAFDRNKLPDVPFAPWREKFAGGEKVGGHTPDISPPQMAERLMAHRGFKGYDGKDYEIQQAFGNAMLRELEKGNNSAHDYVQQVNFELAKRDSSLVLSEKTLLTVAGTDTVINFDENGSNVVLFNSKEFAITDKQNSRINIMTLDASLTRRWDREGNLISGRDSISNRGGAGWLFLGKTAID